MKLFNTLAISLLSLSSTVLAADSWSFQDATLTIRDKGAGVDGGDKESLDPTTKFSGKQLSLSPNGALKIALTATEGKTAKRPHQAWLTLHEPLTGLEESLLFTINEKGKGKIEVTQKDLPYQLLTSSQPLQATILLASFGQTAAYTHHAFDLTISAPSDLASTSSPPPSERYGRKEEIHHIFRSDPQSPPRIISLFFTLTVLAMLPGLYGVWAFLGGNLGHFGTAMGKAPMAHGLFLGSIVAMEGVFGLYYVGMRLFSVLPLAGVVAVVMYISGSRALTEVQERRLQGQR
ncbi:hypothetical protein MBLNU230_g2387t1 [Neophaeotheca triangularis]